MKEREPELNLTNREKWYLANAYNVMERTLIAKRKEFSSEDVVEIAYEIAKRPSAASVLKGRVSRAVNKQFKDKCVELAGSDDLTPEDIINAEEILLKEFAGKYDELGVDMSFLKEHLFNNERI